MSTTNALQTGLLFLTLLTAGVYAQRVAPGVPPQHYQQVPVQQHPSQQQYQQQHHPQQQQHHPQQQHVAPGVAPQQYQQYQQVPVQQQQQYQQQIPQQVPQGQPVQHQQQQIHQQQQPPIHQQQQQPIHQQQPQHHAQQPQHHGHHGQPQQVLNANVQHEREHIQEHMQVPIDTSKMSEAELQFHYFKMHDSDNNNKLDGCELIKSLIHWHVDDEKKKDDQKEAGHGTGHKGSTVYTDENLSDIIDYVLKQMDENHDGYVDYAEYRKNEDSHATSTTD